MLPVVGAFDLIDVGETARPKQGQPLGVECRLARRAIPRRSCTSGGFGSPRSNPSIWASAWARLREIDSQQSYIVIVQQPYVAEFFDPGRQALLGLRSCQQRLDFLPGIPPLFVLPQARLGQGVAHHPQTIAGLGTTAHPQLGVPSRGTPPRLWGSAASDLGAARCVCQGSRQWNSPIRHSQLTVLRTQPFPATPEIPPNSGTIAPKSLAGRFPVSNHRPPCTSTSVTIR